MSRTIHCCLSVRGALRWNKRKLRQALKWIRKDDGSPYRDADELRDAFFDELAQGHEVIPMAKDCPGFDFKTGCPGHEEIEEVAR